MTSKLGRYAPLTGVLFVAVTMTSFIIGGEAPEEDSSAAEIVKFYTDNETENFIAAIGVSLAGAILVFFGAVLRDIFKKRGAGSIANVIFGGSVIAGCGFMTAAAIHFALVEAAKDVEPDAVQALNALDYNFFLPFAHGLVLLILAASLAAFRTRALPLWIAWLGVALFVISFTPIGFAGFIGSGVWTIIVSILLTVRRATEQTEAPVREPALSSS